MRPAAISAARPVRRDAAIRTGYGRVPGCAHIRLTRSDEPAAQLPQTARGCRQRSCQVSTGRQVDAADGPGIVSCSGRPTSRRRTTALLATLRGELGGERQQRHTEDLQIGLHRRGAAAVPSGEQPLGNSRRDRRHSGRDGRPPPRSVERWRDRGGSQRVGAAAATTAGRGSRSSPPSSSGARSRPSALSPPARSVAPGSFLSTGHSRRRLSSSVGRAGDSSRGHGGACWSSRPRPGLR